MQYVYWGASGMHSCRFWPDSKQRQEAARPSWANPNDCLSRGKFSTLHSSWRLSSFVLHFRPDETDAEQQGAKVESLICRFNYETGPKLASCGALNSVACFEACWGGIVHWKRMAQCTLLFHRKWWQNLPAARPFN